MYARVASFEGRDASLTDELIERVRDAGPTSVPDARGFLGLFDRERGTSLAITFFDSEQAITGRGPYAWSGPSERLDAASGDRYLNRMRNAR